MRDPFKITGPAVISFSGGRTSGMMLFKILEAHGGKFPPDVLVCFCNTGKERPETLDFVEECSQRWSVPIVWLEYRYDGEAMPPHNGDGVKRKTPGKHTFTVVDYATASRKGEPFEQLIKGRGMLPNVVARFCTVEMKIRTQQRYLVSIGWDEGWTACIGLRADEPQRVARLRSTNRHNNEDPIAPLASAGITLADVDAFWNSQPFNLKLKSYEGNCDLCYLKGAGKITRIMREKPETAEWWIRMESLLPRDGTGTYRFRCDRPSYAALLEQSKRPSLFPLEMLDDPDELSIACHCTD